MPDGLVVKLVGLTTLNLAHNKIGNNEQSADGGDEDMEDADIVGAHLPKDFVDRFGVPDELTGQCRKDELCVVRLEGNPLAEKLKKRHLEEEKRKAKEAKEAQMETEATE